MADQNLEDRYPFIGDAPEDRRASGAGSSADAGSGSSGDALHFEAADLDARLAATSDEALDDAPFGLIRVGRDGVVQFYNQFESEFAGVAPSDALDRNFFTEVAPCSNNSLFYGRFKKLRDRDAYDDRFSYTFTYKMRPTLVHVRMLNDTDGRHWIAVNPQ
jgi:photoactive yellow protein